MVVLSARPGGPESTTAPEGLDELIRILLSKVEIPQRDVDGPLLFAVDHCFSIKGQGTVLTGTVLRGTVEVGTEVELPAQGISRKVKSMQMFRRPVTRASMGDRLGMCVTSLDAKSIERGVVCAPGSLPALTAAVARVEKIRFFKSAVKTKTKFHLSVGHATVMCSVTFFGSDEGGEDIDLAQDYHYLEELALPRPKPADDAAGAAPEVSAGEVVPSYRNQFVLLEFDSPVNCSPGALVIGSRLDADVHTPHCRLAFSGTLVMHTTTVDDKPFVQQLRVFKPKVPIHPSSSPSCLEWKCGCTGAEIVTLRCGGEGREGMHSTAWHGHTRISFTLSSPPLFAVYR
jgi:selenocysteine-specific elongation factor